MRNWKGEPRLVLAMHPDAAAALRHLVQPFGREVTRAAEVRVTGSTADTDVLLPLEMAAIVAAAAMMALPMPVGFDQRRDVPPYLPMTVAGIVADARNRGLFNAPAGVGDLELVVKAALMLVAADEQPDTLAEAAYLRRIFELALRRYARALRHTRRPG